MDAREIEILRYFESGPAPVKPLLNRYPKSTLYRLIEGLLNQRLLLKDGTSYRLLPGGHEALDTFAAPPARPTAAVTLERHIPHLRHVPTPFHRALLELIACAVVARRHKLRTSHHPAFVVFGPKLKWKTWITKAACLIAGGNPAHDVVYLGTESGRSMLCRKGAKGQRVTSRAALDKSIVGLDEYLRAKTDVRQLVQIYLLGEISVPDENEVLAIEPVPIVTLNPREDRTSLDERVGLDEATLRRSILADLSAIDIPAALLAEGEVLLDRVQVIGPASLPAPRRPGWEPRDDMKGLLLAALDGPERLAGIDITMLAMLATAATAWLEPAEALRLVATNYLTIVTELGWTNPEWRRHMDTPDDSKPAALPGSTTSDPRSDPNPLDYDARLHALADVCARLALSPADAESRLRLMEGVHKQGMTIEAATCVAAELERTGVGAADGAKRIARCVLESGSLEQSCKALGARVASLEAQAAEASRRLQETRQTMASLHWDPGRVQALRALDDGLSKVKLSLEDTAAIVTIATDIATLTGAAPTDAPVLARRALQSLATELREAGAGQDLNAPLKLIAGAAARGARIQAEVEALQAASTDARNESAKLTAHLGATRAAIQAGEQRKLALAAETRRVAAEVDAWSRSLSNMKAACSKVADQHMRMASEVAFANELLRYLEGNVWAYDELWRALCDLAQVRLRKSPSSASRSAELSEAVRKRLLEILRKALDGDLVARWELDAFKAAARRTAALELRAELGPAAIALKTYEEAARSQRTEIEQVMNKLLWKS